MLELITYLGIGLAQVVGTPFVKFANLFTGTANYKIEIFDTHSYRKQSDIITNFDALVVIESSEKECEKYNLLTFSSKKVIIVDGSLNAPVDDFNLKKCPLQFRKLSAGTILKVVKYADLTPKTYSPLGTHALSYLIVSDPEGNLYDIYEPDYKILSSHLSSKLNGEGYATQANIDWNALLSNTHKLCGVNEDFDDRFDKFSINYKFVEHINEVSHQYCYWFKFNDVESLKTAAAIYQIRPSPN